MAERAAGTVTRSTRGRPLTEPGSIRRGGAVNEVLPLRRSVDVRATMRNGATAGGPAAVVHACRRQDREASRATVVAGRRLGNAVARNRAKRRLRAAFSEVAVGPGFDLVLVARRGAITADYQTLRMTLASSVARAVARAEGRR